MTSSTLPLRERTPRRIAFSQKLGRWDIKFSPYLYISPFFLLFALVGLFPLLYTGWVSLHRWDLIAGQGPMVWFDNFTWVLQQRQFWIALRNTLSIFLLSAVPQIVFALLIAAVLDTNLRGRTFWRMSVLLPYIVMPVAVALIFSNMFGDRYGLVNTTLGHLGIPAIQWHSDPFASQFAIATMVNFRWTGYNALILLAGMQAIPRDLYESAAIDGAGRVRRFFSITIPQLRPTLIFVIITATIGGLQIFDEPRLFDQNGTGGANQQWMTLTLYLYNLGWGQLDFGRAAAVAWLLFLIIVVIGLINLAITRRISSNGGVQR
ncbi:carbohydrate ABC transporter permease [Galbitalea soli]|uniref:Sugar ABC transporter permease n=1 Tax=Galbitalea soli TaxID=1268042 RepID=A0A7C9PQ78_9MICO|nr:sugar ABC transporter permease [Galbitalea soli]NEM92531.1 sugar ABC transporter permease [Galbitalea soli]NYJ29568.1 cellobiose transport system permease protein [Galbitalea soli]